MAADILNQTRAPCNVSHLGDWVDEKKGGAIEEMKTDDEGMETEIEGEDKAEQATSLDREVSRVPEDLSNLSTDVLELWDSSEESCLEKSDSFNEWPLTQMTEIALSHCTPEGNEKKPKVSDFLSMHGKLIKTRLCSS